MLIITLQNDSTGNEDIDHYNVIVRVNAYSIYSTRIANHKRKEGWWKLLKRLLEEKQHGH